MQASFWATCFLVCLKSRNSRTCSLLALPITPCWDISVKTFSSNYKVLEEALRLGSACYLFRVKDYEIYLGHRSYTALPTYNRYFFSNLHAPISRVTLPPPQQTQAPSHYCLRKFQQTQNLLQHEMMGKKPLPSRAERPLACPLPLPCGCPAFGLATKHHTWPMPSSVFTRAVKSFLKGS